MKKIILMLVLITTLVFSVSSFANISEIDEISMQERMLERTEIGEVLYKSDDVIITYKGIIKSNILDGFDVLVEIKNLKDYEQTVQIRDVFVNEKPSSGIFSLDVSGFSTKQESIYINAVNKSGEFTHEIIDLSLEFVGFNKELMLDTFRTSEITIKN